MSLGPGCSSVSCHLRSPPGSVWVECVGVLLLLRRTKRVVSDVVVPSGSPGLAGLGSMSSVDTGLCLGLPRGRSFPRLLPSPPSSSLYTCTKDEIFTYPCWRIEFWTEAWSKSPGPLNGNSSHPEVQLSSWFYCVSQLGVGGFGAQLFGVHSPCTVCGV